MVHKSRSFSLLDFGRNGTHNSYMTHSNTQSVKLEMASQYHQAGRFQKAESIYLRVLSQEPTNFDALHLFGLLKLQQGKHESAVELIGRAIKINRKSPEAFNHLGEAFRALKQLQEAERSYRQALILRPDFVEAYHNLGNVLRDSPGVYSLLRVMTAACRVCRSCAANARTRR